MGEVTGAWGAAEEELDCSSEKQDLPIEPGGQARLFEGGCVSPVVLYPFEPQAMTVLRPNVLLPAPYLAEFRRALAEAPGQEGPQLKRAGRTSAEAGRRRAGALG